MESLAYMMCICGFIALFLFGSVLWEFALWYFEKRKEEKRK